MTAFVLRADARSLPIPDASVDLIVTSPPYWALRSYTDGGEHYDGQIGSEATPAEWVDALVECTAEIVRVLKPTGSIFVNLGDKYSGAQQQTSGRQTSGVPAKSLCLLPERYRIACVDRLGLIARAVVVWDKPNCLSGGTQVYAQVKGRPLSIKVHDLCRAYQPEDVQLWNGQRWTQVLWWQPTGRHEDAIESYKAIRAAGRCGDAPVVGGDIEIELRSGERIGCTREHRWPTRRGLVQASDLIVGDILDAVQLPEGEAAPAALDDEMVGWFVGLYIAEGSRSERTIQIAGYVNELERYKRLRELAEAFHGTCVVHATGGNAANINLTGQFLEAVIGTYVGGRTAKDKHLAPKCWQRSNRFLQAVLDGYLSGDGHYDKAKRWIVRFTDNDALAADLRTLGARLGFSVRLRRVTHTGFGREWPGWSGSIVEPERRRQPDTEIVAVRQSRARKFWDIGVEDGPHLFALASGVLTHNSLPESVTDRVRRSHEDWVHLVKQPRYFSDVDVIREVQQSSGERHIGRSGWVGATGPGAKGVPRSFTERSLNPLGKLPGSVWSIPSEPLSVPDELGVQHFAAFPTSWPKRLILGWSPAGICAACGEGRRQVPAKLRPQEAYAAAIRAARDRAGMSRAEFAATVGCGTNNVWDWEVGGHLPRGAAWGRIATALGLDMSRDEFIARAEYAAMSSQDTERRRSALAAGASRPYAVRAVRVGGPTTETCDCPDTTAPTRPAVVLDPFGGTGTTALVAAALGRVGVTVDRSADYCRIARWRTTDPAQIAKVRGEPFRRPEPQADGQVSLFGPDDP